MQLILKLNATFVVIPYSVRKKILDKDAIHKYTISYCKIKTLIFKCFLFPVSSVTVVFFTVPSSSICDVVIKTGVDVNMNICFDVDITPKNGVICS